MKALVLAETIDGQRALCAGARSIADEVVLAVVKGAPETGIADKAYDIELPAGEPVENAAAGVIAVYNAENPDVVLVEPTPRDKILACLLYTSFAVCGLGIAFLMWNVTYPVFIALPNRFKVVGGIVLAQQLIGLIGESLLLAYLPHASFLFAASIMRFIYFDAFGLLIMTVAFVLLCVFSYRVNHPRA